MDSEFFDAFRVNLDALLPELPEYPGSPDCISWFKLKRHLTGEQGLSPADAQHVKGCAHCAAIKEKLAQRLGATQVVSATVKAVLHKLMTAASELAQPPVMIDSYMALMPARAFRGADRGDVRRQFNVVIERQDGSTDESSLTVTQGPFLKDEFLVMRFQLEAHPLLSQGRAIEMALISMPAGEVLATAELPATESEPLVKFNLPPETCRASCVGLEADPVRLPFGIKLRPL
jgi:hypothetical protein